LGCRGVELEEWETRGGGVNGLEVLWG
jgi:hypothetical protein